MLFILALKSCSRSYLVLSWLASKRAIFAWRSATSEANLELSDEPNSDLKASDEPELEGPGARALEGSDVLHWGVSEQLYLESLCMQSMNTFR